jgi:hypothetical protein
MERRGNSYAWVEGSWKPAPSISGHRSTKRPKNPSPVPKPAISAKVKVKVKKFTNRSIVPPRPSDYAAPKGRSGHILIEAHWEWQGNRWVWVSHKWEKSRGTDFIWVPGHMEKKGNHYVWVTGRWEPAAKKGGHGSANQPKKPKKPKVKIKKSPK